MRVYLDHNATSPLLPEARAAMQAALEAGGNPSSVHAEGRAARRTVEVARAEVAALVGAKPAEIVFTSGGSEANALALRGTVGAHGIKRLLVGATEHDSVLAVADDLAGEAGLTVARIPVDRNGRIDLIQFQRLLAQSAEPTLVSVMLANNETGVIAPLDEVVRLAKDHGAVVHSDAAQAIGRIGVSFKDLGVDLLTVSAHKFGGPVGVGALVVRDGFALARQIAGGGQELGRRAGTENVGAIAGLGAAAKWAREHHWGGTSALRDRIEAETLAADLGVVVYGADVPRLPNTSSLAMPRLDAATQIMCLDLAGYGLSAGAACSSGKVKRSHVLDAMGADGADRAIRISLGPSTTKTEIDSFLKFWLVLARTGKFPVLVAVAA